MALAGLAIAVLIPALSGGFIFDDDSVLTGNRVIHAADGLGKIWLGRGTADYWPVTSTSFWLEWRAWGLRAAGYHATNVVLAVAGVVLLWRLLRQLRHPAAWLAACLFAVHPITVESAAWIAERKNLLAFDFGVLAVLLVTLELEWLGLAAFALGMLSKGSIVFLPAVVLVVLRKPKWRAIPFFVVGAGMALFESRFSTLNPAMDAGVALAEKMARAGAIVMFYLQKAVWPAPLSFDYGPLGTAHSWLPLAGVIVATAAIWRWRPVRLAWLYFLAALSPVLGFFAIGFMQYSPVSDHFAHLAVVAPCALAAWALARWGRKGHVAGAVLAAGLAALAWRQSWRFADAERLYTATIQENPRSWLAHNNLAVLYAVQGRLAEAVAEGRETASLRPNDAKSHNNLGVALDRAGDLRAAESEYREAIRLLPDYPQAHNNLGATLARFGHLREAKTEFETALRLDPAFPDARNNLARANRDLAR